eukprot:TRINITY_DN565_c0_g3_i8.p1 TRINITY_DN565_c0_g3~~TRINITY_DN565_c0_g3_i8.p1  ORF type:complete len:1152 (+),score=266.25 TRINITY_DN565_c0_g3_i8:12-3467(+)
MASRWLMLLSIQLGYALAATDAWPIARFDTQNTAYSPSVHGTNVTMPVWAAGHSMGADPIAADTAPILYNGGGVLIVATSNNKMAAIDVATNTRLWTTAALDGACVSAAHLQNSANVFAGCGTRAYVLNGNTGATVASYGFVNQVSSVSLLPYSGTCCIAVSHIETMTVLNYDGTYKGLYAYNGAIPQPAIVSGTLVFLGNSAGPDGTININAITFDGLTFSLRGGWTSTATGGAVKAVVRGSDSYLYIMVLSSASASWIAKLDSTSGSELARYTCAGCTLSKQLSVGGGKIFVVDTAHTLRAISTSTMTLAASVVLPFGSAYTSPTATAGGTVLVGSGNYVVALDSSTLQIVWTWSAGGVLVTSISVSCDGIVFAASATSVFAIGTNNNGCSGSTTTRTRTRSRTRTRTHAFTRTRTRSRSRSRTRSRTTTRTRSRTTTRTRSRTTTRTRSRTTTRTRTSRSTFTRTQTTHLTSSRTNHSRTRTRTPRASPTQSRTSAAASMTPTALSITERVAVSINTTLNALTSSPNNAAQSLLEISHLISLIGTDHSQAALAERLGLRECLLHSALAALGEPRNSTTAVSLIGAQMAIVSAVAALPSTELSSRAAELSCAIVSATATDGFNTNLSVASAQLLLSTAFEVQELALLDLASVPSVFCPSSQGISIPSCDPASRILSLVSVGVADPSGAPVVLQYGSEDSAVTMVVQQISHTVSIVASPTTGVFVRLSGATAATAPDIATVLIFPPNQNPNTAVNGTQTVNLGSVVVSVTITTVNGTIVQPPGGVTITIPPAPGLVEARCTKPTCSYFDEAAGVWRSDGLTTNIIRDSSGQITSYECTTPHLTDFAVLLLAEDGCESVFAKYKDMFLAFTVLFGLFFAVAAVQTVRSVIYARRAKTGATAAWLRVAMLGAAACGLFCRLVYTAMAASGALDNAAVVELAVLLSLPYYFLFLAFVAVLAQWASMTSTTPGLSMPVKVGAGTAITAITAILAAMWAVCATASTRDGQAQAAAIGSYLVGAACTAMAFGFVGFGGRILLQSSGFAAASSKQAEMHRKLYAVTCAYSVAFVVEACLWVFSLVALDEFAAHFLAFYVVFLLVELFTYATLLFATRKFAGSTRDSKGTRESVKASSSSAASRVMRVLRLRDSEEQA